LVEDHPGPPVYITKQLTAEQRAHYRNDLKSIAVDVHKLAPDVPAKARMRKIARCIDQVIGDLEEHG
jgi:hypothetical protein